jgi:hypothetical protein
VFYLSLILEDLHFPLDEADENEEDETDDGVDANVCP